MDYGDEEEYFIVGSAEADPFANKISNESPVGKAALGQIKGAVIEVEVPAGLLSNCKYYVSYVRAFSSPNTHERPDNAIEIIKALKHSFRQC